MPQTHLTHDHNTLHNLEKVSTLRNNQNLLLKTIKGKVLIWEEAINLHHHHHHHTIPEVIRTQMMMIQTIEMTTEGERVAGRHTHLDNRLCPEICLQKLEL